MEEGAGCHPLFRRPQPKPAPAESFPSALPPDVGTATETGHRSDADENYTHPAISQSGGVSAATLAARLASALVRESHTLIHVTAGVARTWSERVRGRPLLADPGRLHRSARRLLCTGRRMC